ncbi:MAG: hypothetical protein QOH88_960 [Verrucomicrobiota bacterium]|jgi:hypothetical protein
MRWPKIVFLLVVAGCAFGAEEEGTNRTAKPAFTFQGVDYFHRWSKGTQHEFTPEGQEDTEKWTDMITVNDYPDVEDGDSLATTANAVLENYKNAKAKVIKTNSVPRTPSRPAEHFIVVLFNRPAFAEVAFARFKLLDGKGHSYVCSHRAYGEKAGEQASAWLSANGSKIEKALMGWTSMPSSKSLPQEKL